jgi:membrane-associated phospholipid phosphatase
MKALNDYLLNLSLAYMVCYIGFMFFPLATQMHYSPDMYNVPLDGWVFTHLGELIRTHLHEPGAALPSPHCAAGTVMLVMSLRYSPRGFLILLPVILTLYFSTVYCRYHYLWDSVGGIVVAIIVLKTSPLLTRLLTPSGRALSTATGA